jgi:hypothetical protein
MLNDDTRRTPRSPANDLICIGELMQALGGCDEISPSLIGWLGDLVTEAADKVFVALDLPRGKAKLPEPDA